MSKPKKSFMSKVRKTVSEKIYRPERTREVFDRMKRDAGFIPIFNIDDTEQRRQELSKALDKIKKKSLKALNNPKVQKEIVTEAYALFFLSANPWDRGLDNRELASKVADFLWLYNEIADLPAFLNDLFMCAMQLVNLSWQALDVTNTPPYIIESRPVVFPPKGGGYPSEQSDDMGLREMKEELEQMRAERKKG